MNKHEPQLTDDQRKRSVGLGIIFGVALGLVFGVATNQLSVGIGAGMAVGAGLGAAGLFAGKK